MTIHTPFPIVRRSAAGLLAVLLVGLGAAATADDAPVQFYLHPTDSTVVAGHAIAFSVTTALNPGSAQYQWYRNNVAIPGATYSYYRFVAQAGDDGTRYHVVAQGYPTVYKMDPNPTKPLPAVGPTASRQATLTVLPAGSSLTPSITAPAADATIVIDGQHGNFIRCDAIGNDLEWHYSAGGDMWHALGTPTCGAQAILLLVNSEFPLAAVRVIDDAGVAVTRTVKWAIDVGGDPNKTVKQAVYFTAGPADATVVAGHQVGFTVSSDITESAVYQWYRNDVAIPGATAVSYRFTAQAADNGARYHVVASGTNKRRVLVPTESTRATLTVLAAGTALPPQIVAPDQIALYMYDTGVAEAYGFRAIGNNLAWSYRYAEDAAGAWRALDATTTGSQFVPILLEPGRPPHASVSLQVVDDAGVAAVRTWAIVVNQYPVIAAVTVNPNPVLWPGPVTLSVTASDPDGDNSTYYWSVDYAASAPGGDAVFTPSGNTCTATFTKFGVYQIYAVVADGKGGRGQVQKAYPPINVQPTFDMRTDVNEDGVVNALDLGVVKDNFGMIVP